MKDSSYIVNAIESGDMKVYKMEKHDNAFVFQNHVYTYHASGLTKDVYLRDDGMTVMKFPVYEDDGYYVAQIVLEAEAWEMADDEARSMMVETRWIEEIGAIEQEFCPTVIDIENPNCREVGVTRDGRVVVFDTDCLYDQYKRPYNGYRYGALAYMTKDVRNSLQLAQGNLALSQKSS